MSAAHSQPWKAKLLLLVGSAFLLQSGYAVIMFSNFRKVQQQLHLTLPLDIIATCCIGLLLCLIAIIQLSGNFKGKLAVPELATRSYDTLQTRRDFNIFNHRGKVLNRAAAASDGGDSSSQGSKKTN
jgi:hypothetical protein